MSPGRLVKRGRYLIFRVTSSPSNKPIQYFLTEGRTWSRHLAEARKGTYSAMMAVMAKIKTEFPDVILEEYRE